MAVGINGWMELRHRPRFPERWVGAVKISSLVIGHYDMFSCLFGVPPYAPFEPIAAGRGLPKDLSEEASDEYLTWEDAFGESWITWSEIERIDWSEEVLDGRPHEYRPDASGTLVYAGKSGPREGDPLEEGRTWQRGETTYRVERVARRDVLNAPWELLFRLMETLAQEYGGDSVRLVVWFDP